MSSIYATAADVDTGWDQSFLDPDKPELIARVNQLLNYAHALVRSKIAGLEDKVLDGTVDVDLLQMIIVTAVIRVLNNPKGVLGAGTGEANFYFSQTGSQKYGGLSIDADDLAVLGIVAGVPKVRSYRMSAPFTPLQDQTWRS